MALGRILLGWALVTVWLVGWGPDRARGCRGRSEARQLAGGEALLLTLFGALWFGSLGAGAWWLVFSWSRRSASGRAVAEPPPARAPGRRGLRWCSGWCGCFAPWWQAASWPGASGRGADESGADTAPEPVLRRGTEPPRHPGPPRPGPPWSAGPRRSRWQLRRTARRGPQAGWQRARGRRSPRSGGLTSCIDLG